MSEISWMVNGQQSDRTYITAPNGEPARIAAALDRLDIAPVPAPKRGFFGRKQATDSAVSDIAEAAGAEKDVVRIPQAGVVDAVHAILAADRSQEQHVHDLAWRISATEDVDSDPEAAAAADELFDLQEQLDPES